MMFFILAGVISFNKRKATISGKVNPEVAKKGETYLLQGIYNNNPIKHTALYDFAQSLKMIPYKNIGSLPKIQSYHQGMS